MGELRVIGESSTVMFEEIAAEDLRISWSMEDAEKVALAEKMFNEYVTKGWIAVAEKSGVGVLVGSGVAVAVGVSVGAGVFVGDGVGIASFVGGIVADAIGGFVLICASCTSPPQLLRIAIKIANNVISHSHIFFETF